MLDMLDRCDSATSVGGYWADASLAQTGDTIIYILVINVCAAFKLS